MARDNTRITTRRRALATLGAGAGLALAGCTGGSSSGGKTVRYLSDRGGSKDIMDKIVSEFEKNSDYTVDVTYTAHGNSLDEQLQKMKAAGNPPDILFVTSADAYRYQKNGNAAAVTEAVKDNDLPDPVHVDGDSYFAPAVVEPLMGWYRNDLYDSDPKTWSAWKKEAARVTQNTDLHGYVVQSGQTNNADTQMTQYLWNNGVNIYSGQPGDISVEVDKGDNKQKAVDTFSWVKDMSQYSPNGSGWEWGDAIGALQQENAAAIASVGGLSILSIASNRPKLVDKLSPMAFPVPSGRSMDPWWAYMEGLVVRSDGKATDGARQFVDFFTKSSSFLDFVLSQPLFQFPPRKSQLESDAVKNNDTLQKHQDALDLVKNNWDHFSTILETGTDGAPNLTAANAYNVQAIGQAADQMLVGGKSPSETVDWLGQKLRSL